MATLHGGILSLIAVTSVAACEQTSTAVGVDLPAIKFADGFQQSDANAIIQECNAHDIDLTVHPSGQIEFMPSPAADYDAAVCVLNYIKESGTTKFGFVGNETESTPEEGQ